jgi:predicted DNA-binding transcriptional regulator AlpA
MAHSVLLTEGQAAEWLTVRKKTLQAWRVRGGGPKFVKLGRCVRYVESDLEEFVALRTLNHTSSMAPQRVGAQEG